MNTIITKYKGLSDPDKYAIKMGIFIICNIAFVMYDRYYNLLGGGTIFD